MNKDDLRITIKDVLERLNMYSDGAVELLMGTCAVESDFCKFDKQIGGGPALGWWQMEPATMNDLWSNYIKYKEGLKAILASEFEMYGPNIERLQNDPEYGIVMARLLYRRSKTLIPDADDIAGLATTWKKVYNTYLGKGTVEKFIKKYKQHCI